MKKLKVLILAIVLFIISAIVIILMGKTYTIKIDRNDYSGNLNECNLIIENEKIVKCIDKSVKNGTLNIRLKSISKGKTSLIISSPGNSFSTIKSIYVHDGGIITYNDYFGDSTGSIIIPISITIWIAYVVLIIIKKYKEELNKNMYQYKNVTYLGLIIFLVFTLINQLYTIFNYKGLIYTIRAIIGLCSSFSSFLLPIAFVLSVLVTISNIMLVKKEGMNLRNLLGVFLGMFFCFSTVFPYILNDILQNATWIDVHNEQGIATYIQEFIEVTIYTIVTYIECVLIGTIILGFKSSKNKPKYDKDCIIILGCQIRKDGNLTNLLKGRVDRAIEFAKMQKQNTNKDIIFVPSGGKGNDEVVSEAIAMKNYLLKQGVKEENILIEDKSTNTFENIKYSNNLIKEKIDNAKMVFSTTNYHVFRAGCIATQQNLNIEGIGAKTKSYF